MSDPLTSAYLNVADEDLNGRVQVDRNQRDSTRGERQRKALEAARSVEQAERRAEDAEAEVERLRSLLAKVQRVFDLQCPPMLPSKYDDRGAWMAHAWWDKVLGPILRQVATCEWCGQHDGHANGCRLGRGPDEGGCGHDDCVKLPTKPPTYKCGECGDIFGCRPAPEPECPSLCGEHHWLDRPESDTRECLICGIEATG